ncbi:response regulator [Isoalcanivorax indicus]|uniref:response regulator n=1 Tax=Isoalcanivorax indicus TaxID=2202653 RepID=UPI000DB950DB|nr:response regulator [Isoalcanivorax indicus]
MARILIIEDEPKIASLLSDYLSHAGHDTAIAGTGEAGLAALREQRTDVVLLDLMLPDMDGLEVCKRLRTFTDTPVIMVTARVEEVDRLLGLELGADDYICKPFSPREVVARVKALLRRIDTLGQDKAGDAAASGLELDDNRIEVRYQGKAVTLTVVEFALLKTLASHPGHIRSRQQLIDRIYNDNRVVSDRTVDSHIKKLRRKLADAFPEVEFIHSIYGAGYRFELAPRDEAD